MTILTIFFIFLFNEAEASTLGRLPPVGSKIYYRCNDGEKVTNQVVQSYENEILTDNIYDAKSGRIHELRGYSLFGWVIHEPFLKLNIDKMDVMNYRIENFDPSESFSRKGKWNFYEIKNSNGSSFNNSLKTQVLYNGPRRIESPFGLIAVDEYGFRYGDYLEVSLYSSNHRALIKYYLRLVKDSSVLQVCESYEIKMEKLSKKFARIVTSGRLPSGKKSLNQKLVKNINVKCRNDNSERKTEGSEIRDVLSWLSENSIALDHPSYFLIDQSKNGGHRFLRTAPLKLEKDKDSEILIFHLSIYDPGYLKNYLLYWPMDSAYPTRIIEGIIDSNDPKFKCTIQSREKLPK